jgi:hypothetical protein
MIFMPVKSISNQVSTCMKQGIKNPRRLGAIQVGQSTYGTFNLLGVLQESWNHGGKWEHVSLLTRWNFHLFKVKIQKMWFICLKKKKVKIQKISIKWILLKGTKIAYKPGWEVSSCSTRSTGAQGQLGSSIFEVVGRVGRVQYTCSSSLHELTDKNNNDLCHLWKLILLISNCRLYQRKYHC